MIDTLNLKIYSEIENLPDEWDSLEGDILLSYEYLKAKQITLPKNFTLRYIAVFENGKIVGKIVVELIKIKGENLFKQDVSQWKKWIYPWVNFNLLSFGNMMLTGNHVLKVKEGYKEQEIYSYLIKNLKLIKDSFQTKVDFILFKEYLVQEINKYQPLFKNYHAFEVQPNMIIDILPTWNTYEDYLAGMKNKYRTRAKRARKKQGEIYFKEIGLEELIEINPILFSLFENVADNAKINPYRLPSSYFVEMKKYLKDKFRVVVGFKDKEPVCFYTLIYNGENLLSGFLGYDEDLQRRHQLYLNMLYEMVDFSIEKGFKKLLFSRTALEIKSSVGAKPEEMVGFMKGNKWWVNWLLPWVVSNLNPSERWEERNVFK